MFTSQYEIIMNLDGFLVSSKHNYVTYAVHNYVYLQFSSFGMEIYQQLYTPPMTALVFSTFWAGIFVSNSTKLCSKLGGELMCVHPVSHARRTWIGRTSAGPILILWGGEWWLFFVTCHACLSLPYILGRFLSTIFVSNSWSQNSILLNWKFRLSTRSSKAM